MQQPRRCFRAAVLRPPREWLHDSAGCGRLGGLWVVQAVCGSRQHWPLFSFMPLRCCCACLSCGLQVPSLATPLMLLGVHRKVQAAMRS